MKHQKRPLRASSALGFLGLLLCLGQFGCARSQQAHAKVAELRTGMDQARTRDAMRCAPRQLALADAELEFAELALSQGSLSRAETHLRRGEWNLRAAELVVGEESCKGKRPVETQQELVETDLDGDGISDQQDRCPQEAEVQNGFEDEDGCPDDVDTDGDTLFDQRDLCPLLAEDRDGFEDEDGCPELDNDLDGLLDGADRCPLQAEDPDGYEDQDGCPEVDNDGDSVLDPADACPNTPGSSTGTRAGCPEGELAFVLRDCLIEVLREPEFSKGKDTLTKAGQKDLEQVLKLLEHNPQLELEIQAYVRSGTTNSLTSTSKSSSKLSKAQAQKQQSLSEKRAFAIKRYLVSHGVSAARLDAEGYGAETPSSPNISKLSKPEQDQVLFLRTEASKLSCGLDGQTPPAAAR